MRRITKIERTGNEVKPSKLRVAAYARVSTASEEQLLSLKVQKLHYESFIKENPDWELAGLYYDEGISGTKKDGRTGLLEMLKDCEKGKIDRVITKSISRFARNTTDCLEMVRKLSSLGVTIYFEKENIDTGSMESELMLTILSSMAESESVSISQNNKWSITKKFQSGEYIISTPSYGYKNVDGQMVVDPEEAKVIRRIFSDCLNGKGTYIIAKELELEGVKTSRGGTWQQSTILGLLRNEVYIGDARFQKTYSDEKFRQRINRGEKNMYYVEDHHEPIISREDFRQVQLILEQRRKEKSIQQESLKYQTRYAFSGIIICGECGGKFKRKYVYIPSGRYVIWSCGTHIKDKKSCSMLAIKDDDIKAAFIRMMNKLASTTNHLLKPFYKGISSISDKDIIAQLDRLQSEAEDNANNGEVLRNLMTAGVLEPATYRKAKLQVEQNEERILGEIARLKNRFSSYKDEIEETKILLKRLKKGAKITEFKDDDFKAVVRTITVESRDSIVFNLRCGLNLTERLGD